MRRGILILSLGWFIILGGIAVALFLFFGGFNVAASSGHWGITRWLLSTVRDNSIDARTPKAATADLSDMERIRLGAGHFATVCEDCHGTPGRPISAIGRAMTPSPPHFSELPAHRTPEELFWIVKHGIKMTGMPAWPALAREDEVWTMAAFLEKAGTMSESEYRELAYGPSWPASEDPLLAKCARCHGLEGLGRGMANLPILAQQKPGYLSNALHAFRSGERHSGIMQSIATQLTDEDIRRISQYYASAARPVNLPSPVDETFERGRTLALRGSADQKIPACSACHGPWPERRNPYYPELRGQPVDYIRKQLELFRAEERGGSEYRNLMRPVVQALSDEDIDAVARYYSSLPLED